MRLRGLRARSLVSQPPLLAFDMAGQGAVEPLPRGIEPARGRHERRQPARKVHRGIQIDKLSDQTACPPVRFADLLVVSEFAGQRAGQRGLLLTGGHRQRRKDRSDRVVARGHGTPCPAGRKGGLPRRLRGHGASRSGRTNVLWQSLHVNWIRPGRKLVSSPRQPGHAKCDALVGCQARFCMVTDSSPQTMEPGTAANPRPLEIAGLQLPGGHLLLVMGFLRALLAGHSRLCAPNTC